MSDPASGALGGAVTNKVLAWAFGLVLMLGAPVLGFVLGLQVIPLNKDDPHRDLVRRLLGCVVSSFLVGLPALIWIASSHPWVFDGARTLMHQVHLPEVVGPLMVLWAVLLVSALPGWWLVGALVKRVASQDWGAALGSVQGRART
jgi:hypothetical protein